MRKENSLPSLRHAMLMEPQESNKQKEMMKFFKKVEFNIPLLDAIQQVPCYAEFLKELCTKKKRLHGDEKIIAGEAVSAVLQCKLPPKCGDLGMF